MNLLRSWFGGPSAAEEVAAIGQRRGRLAGLDDAALRLRFRETGELSEAIAVVAVAAERVLGQRMFDVQLQGALALARGRIAEMQTGEGKTLACTPAVAWLARSGEGVHAMTVNDYLARRDAAWMGPIYRFLGLSVGCIQQTLTFEERRQAYRCDVTYATANELGFDFLRDRIALRPEEQVHRPFHAAVIDEADSILIDEARIPLILAEVDEEVLARRVDPLVRRLHRGVHFTLDEYGRNIALTDAGIHLLETAFDCGNLYDAPNLALYTAVHNGIHAHSLLRRDVDYVIKNGAIESVDEFKGRIAPDRRWPAGLQTAIEANRPVIRIDQPDVLFAAKAAKEQAVVEEIRRVHAAGQPILVGTASVEESERLSRALDGIPHSVLNARNEEEEAGIVARAGERCAVTISTNMAGRGVDIRLGEGVAELGGLYVIGMNKHESRRIDHQLRGRAGRQGDPGRSRFFISLEDDLLARHGIGDPRLQHDAEGIQRLVEGQNLEIRRFLQKYEAVIEGQRQRLQQRRQAILGSDAPELERMVALTTIDDLWSDYLAAVTELRSGVHWYSWGGRDPLHEYLTRVDGMYRELEDGLDAAIAAKLEEARANGFDPSQRGATWTYLTTDRPFGNYTERVLRGLVRKAAKKELWG
jgi:preprotein translocase subunit SecA